jgi:hypothetical protein
MAKTVSPQKLKSLLHDGGEIALLDVREAGQFGESHLLFATPVPYSMLELDAARLVPRKSTRIVLCDEDGAGPPRWQQPGCRRRIRRRGRAGRGNRGWEKAGYALFKGVNVPSKLFGELIEHACHTPRVTVQELARMNGSGRKLRDRGRPSLHRVHQNEHPGRHLLPECRAPVPYTGNREGPCGKNHRELRRPHALDHRRADAHQFRRRESVYALENGTQGWVLADFQLERGATRRYPERVDDAQLPGLRAKASALMERYAVPTVAASEVERWAGDPDRTNGVAGRARRRKNSTRAHFPGSARAGRPARQATDQWVAVRNARLVLLDDEGGARPGRGELVEAAGLRCARAGRRYPLARGCKAARETCAAGSRAR